MSSETDILAEVKSSDHTAYLDADFPHTERPFKVHRHLLYLEDDYTLNRNKKK